MPRPLFTNSSLGKTIKILFVANASTHLNSRKKLQQKQFING